MPVIWKCRFSYWFPLRYRVNVVNWPLNRVLLSYFASVYVRIITGMKIHDATAGFIWAGRIDDNKKFVGYAFQIEMKYRTFVKFSIVEVPIILQTEPKANLK
jgi:dolichol-phosphate mannosyltransferase